MSELLRIRIETKDGLTKVSDADTGREFSCSALKFEHAGIEHTPELTITFLNFDLEAVIEGFKLTFGVSRDEHAVLEKWPPREWIPKSK